MSIPTAAPAPTRIKKTIVTEVLPGNASAREAYPEKFYDRDFWEIIHSLTKEQWEHHLVRVYRAGDRWENAEAPRENKFTEPFDEDTIRNLWGGGRYNLWLYGPPKGSVLQVQYHLPLDGEPKRSNGYRTDNSSNQPADNGGSNVTFLLSELLKEMREARGGTMVQEAMKQSLEIMSTAYKGAVAAVGAPTTPRPSDEIENELRRAMINRFLNPPDPAAGLNGMVSLFTAAAGALKQLSGGLGLAAAKPDMIGSLLDKLPTLADKALEGVKEYRMASEAQERTLRIQAQQQGRVIDVTPAAPQPNGSTETTAAAANVAPPTPTAKGPEIVEVRPPSDEWVLLRLVEIIEKTDDDGEDIVGWLHYEAPGVLKELSGLSRDTVLGFFAKHPVLARVSTHPRLAKLIDEVLAAIEPNPVAN